MGEDNLRFEACSSIRCCRLLLCTRVIQYHSEREGALCILETLCYLQIVIESAID